MFLRASFGSIDKIDCGGFHEKPRAKAQMVAVAVVHSSGHAAARESTYLYQTGELVPDVALLGCGHATDCSRCGSLHPARFDDLRGSAAASCRSAHLGSSTAFLSARASFLSARTAFLSARTALLSTRTVYGTTFRRTERGASGIASCGPLPRHTGNHCSAHFYAAPRSRDDAGRGWRNCRPRSGRREPPSTNRVAADA